MNDPIAENIRTCRNELAALATNPTASVIRLRDLVDKLTWIASQVSRLERQLAEKENGQ